MRNEEAAELTRSRVAGWNAGRKEIVGHEKKKDPSKRVPGALLKSPGE